MATFIVSSRIVTSRDSHNSTTRVEYDTIEANNVCEAQRKAENMYGDSRTKVYASARPA